MRRTLRALLWILVLLPPIYVLSIGPAAWATEHDYGPFDRLVIYKPLNSIYLNSVMARRFLSWYLVLWIDPQKHS
jgi:hypothetical protein